MRTVRILSLFSYPSIPDTTYRLYPAFSSSGRREGGGLISEKLQWVPFQLLMTLSSGPSCHLGRQCLVPGGTAVFRSHLEVAGDISQCAPDILHASHLQEVTCQEGCHTGDCVTCRPQSSDILTSRNIQVPQFPADT